MLADPLAGLHTPLTDLLFLRCRVASAGTVVGWFLVTLAVAGYTGIARCVDAPGRPRAGARLAGTARAGQESLNGPGPRRPALASGGRLPCLRRLVCDQFGPGSR